MADVALRSRVHAAWRLFRLETKRTFSVYYWGAIGGTLFYFTVYSLLNAFTFDEPLQPINIQNAVLWVPMVLVTALLGARVVLMEQDDHTLEVLFSLPGSRGRIWVFKVALVYLAVFGVLLLLAVLSYFFMADISILQVTLHSMVPALLIANLAFLLSLLTRSWIAGSLVTFLVALVIALIFRPFNHLWPYLNPMNVPQSVGAREWFQIVVINRVVNLGLATLLLVIALQRLRVPERLL